MSLKLISHPGMRATEQSNKNLKYVMVCFLVFLTRTVILGICMLEGPYFSVTNSGDERSFRVLFGFASISNMFRFLFIYNVIERKNLFQLILYFPLIIYGMVLIVVLLVSSYRFFPDSDLNHLEVAIAFLYVYLAILALEILITLFIYNRLKNDFRWSSFKKTGANPVLNGKWT